jgi:carotenoid cleavage dioxygenase-like enzyme
MICFGYEAKGDATRDVAVYSVDKNGNITWETWFMAPNVSMLHDIAITEKHVIFVTNCFTTSMERLKAGQIHWGYDRSKPVYVGVLERGGDGKDIRWFKGPEAAVIHTINAFTDGDKIILDSPVGDSNPFPFFPAVDESPFDPSKAACNIRRWTIDLSKKGDTWEETVLFAKPMGGGLARMDDRYIGHHHRYSYMGVVDPSKPFDTAKAGNLQGRVTNCYARYDHAAGKVDTFFAGDTHSLQEGCFVPRRADSPEGDGYLIGVASNYATMKSELVIADAQKLGDGAIARVRMPFRLHAQVHGNWVPADKVPVDL